VILPSAVHAAKVELLLPLGRTVYQTNEWIDVSVVRSDAKPLAAGDLALTLNGGDGSVLTYTFPVKAAARSTEHLHINGALLRPGKYRVHVLVDGISEYADIEIFSHIRKSDFRLINWGRAQGKDQLVQGEDSLGFNLSMATTVRTATPRRSCAPASISCPTAP